MKLRHKHILITGASSGIGRELAIQLAEQQNTLILIARRYQLLQELKQEMAGEGHACFECDVSDSRQVKKVCSRIIAEHAAPDVLILNAGVGGGFDIKEFDLESFFYQFRVNFDHTVQFVKYFVPQMIERGSGVIAAVSSIASFRGMPASAPYSSSKGALDNFMESIRIDLLPHNVQSVLISPGFVKTPLTDRNDFYMPFMISVDKAAKYIIRGLEKNKAEIHFPYRLTLLAKLSRLLPAKTYANLMQGRR